MFKVGISLLLLGSLSFGASSEAAPKLNDKFHDSSRCKTCHMPIVKQWEKSYHAKSHYGSDEYLRASMDYVHRKTRKSINAVKVECAACHNPRMAVTETGIDYEIAAVMGLDKGSAVNKAVKNDALSEGINCLVCHNVNEIHDELPPSERGVHRISWNPVGTMSGPFGDAKSPYHKTQYRDFFGKDPKILSLVCHANDRSESGLVFANTQKEYQETTKQCADCHMSPKKMGMASTLPIDNGRAKQRMVREHGFSGAHTTSMWKDALSLIGKKEGSKLTLTLVNDNPHNIPTGFGARELLIDIVYQSGSAPVDQKQISLTQNYIDKRGHDTIPHLAVKTTVDLSIGANSERSFSVDIPKGADNAVVTVSYRLVNGKVRTLLELKEKQWEEKKFITKANIRF
ncbi:MAG: cytochrome c family protein [Thiovulaceae bacterium]|nr:cytochrome c family protein [Sulfurimonadaceae bacterium]